MFDLLSRQVETKVGIAPKVYRKPGCSLGNSKPT